MYVTLKKVLKDADQLNMAIGAFNTHNLEMLPAIIKAAGKQKSPVIIQTSCGTANYVGHKNLVAICKSMAEEYRVDVVLHLDHAKDFGEIRKAISAGYSSVMVLDGQFVDYSSGMDPEKQKGNDYPIEIVGIFKNTSLEQANDQGQDGMVSSFAFDDRPFNRIYMPNDAVKTIVEEERAGQQAAFPATDFGSDEEFFTPQFILNQPEDAEQFKQEVTPLLPNGYKVNASTDEYDRVGTSMNRLSQISSYVVVIAVIASLIIISLIIVLFTRDRKYELGIYLSLGERRKYVFAQIVLELLLIGVSAMLISLVTGNMLGKMVSESLLSSSMLEANQAGVEQFFVGVAGVPKIDQATINEAFRVQYTLPYIIAFLATGIVTILLSAVVPLLYILRLNPKKIML